MSLLDSYDNPFRSPSPDANRYKRARPESDSEPEDLGIDEQVEVQKRARVPRIKLDEDRLLSEKGIPKLRRKARDLKLKGKGHEFSDATRLLSFYQLWLDDLFPKAKFLDALAMVEKAGHKTSMHKMRMEWINEGKPKISAEDEEGREERQPSLPREPSRIAPVFEKAAQNRTNTPAPVDDDLFGDDIYGASPREGVTDKRTGDVPDDDDLDALMAEAEAHGNVGKTTVPTTTNPFASIFGNGNKTSQPAGNLDDDDLDALLAEAEAESSRSKPAADSTLGKSQANGLPKNSDKGSDDPDDLDALIAEAEGQTQLKGTAEPTGKSLPDADEEEAMAEMDGLW